MSLFPSLMRTAVPLVAGYLLTLLASVNVDFSSESVTAVVTVVLTAAYYTLFRVLERVAPTGGVAEKFFGLLLGYARPPEYPKSTDPTRVTPVRGPPLA